MKIKSPCFVYLRTSGPSQVGADKGGIPRQREAVKAFAKSHRLEIVQEFKDEGVSGARDAFDREGLTDLLVALKADGVKVVLVETATRLARDLVIQEILLAEFKKCNCKCFATDSGTDLSLVEDDSPTTKLIRQVLGAISEWEKSMLVQKLRVGRIRKRKLHGKCEGRRGIGQSTKTKHATDEEIEMINSIVAMKKSGASVQFICNWLNNIRQLKTQTGSQFYPPMVYRILARAENQAKHK